MTDWLAERMTVQGHACDVWIESKSNSRGGRICGQPYRHSYVGERWMNEGLTCATGHFTRRRSLPVAQQAVFLRLLGRSVPTHLQREPRRDEH